MQNNKKTNTASTVILKIRLKKQVHQRPPRFLPVLIQRRAQFSPYFSRCFRSRSFRYATCRTTRRDGQVTKISWTAQSRVQEMGKKWSKQTLRQPGCRVLQSKSFCSSPHTFSQATTKTMSLKMNTMESQIRPNAVEYLFTPLRRPWRKAQFIFRRKKEPQRPQQPVKTECSNTLPDGSDTK